ncbi:MAG: SUKH-4 family immunity protein [Clostridia bacterium]|nr:SUKH-4 family immunity protein [Clostridia bacterium]
MIVTNENIRKHWNYNLIEYSKTILKKYCLSEETISFMSEVGLPINSYVFNFYKDFELREEKIKGKTLVAIAEMMHDDTNYLYIDCLSQELLQTTNHLKSGLSLVNSSVRNFLVFDFIFDFVQKECGNINDDEACKKFGKKVKDIFLEIDPAALGDMESYWSLTLKEYELVSI